MIPMAFRKLGRVSRTSARFPAAIFFAAPRRPWALRPIVAGTVMPAEAKMAQKAAGYQETPAKDGSNCANCALFKAPSSCTLVDGTVSPNGWCRFYSKKS